MRKQHMLLRSLLFVIASLFRLYHCEERKRRSNLIICLITLSLVFCATLSALAIGEKVLPPNTSKDDKMVLLGGKANPATADQYVPLGDGDDSIIYNDIPFRFGGVELDVRHGEGTFVPRDAVSLSGVTANKIHIIESSFWATNVPNGVMVGSINVLYEDGTSGSIDLIMGVNTAEWAYDRPENQCCLAHSKVPPAYSYRTNIDSDSYYRAHSFYVSIDIEDKPLDYLELLLYSASYSGQPSCPESCEFSTPADWFGIGISAITLQVPSAKLFVTIPGINDNGAMMLEGAKKMVRFDDECKVFIMEKLRPSITAVQKAVTNASKKAMEKGKDVVVLIDMDLENYTWEFPLPPAFNRWKRSVRWAGKMANVVSDAFSKEVPGGKRILYAHSAGGDATKQSIALSRGKRMYDNINILNGRTCAVTWLFGFVCRNSLASVLKRSGYGWWQVKVFTNDGDLPANPNWSLSNYDVAKQEAGKSWVHLHCCDITGHSALRDSIPDGSIGTFEVNLMSSSGSPNCIVVSTVKELMTRDWR